MERGSINGIPVWIKLCEIQGQQRTVIKEAPGSDGALVETQGQMPERYRVEFSLINDGQWITSDYETATLELRAAFLSGGPFTIEMPLFGEVTGLWMSAPASLKFFDETRLAITEGSVEFTDAEPQVILQESAAAIVALTIGSYSEAMARAFAEVAPDEGFSEGAIAVLDALGEWLSDVQDKINAAFEPVNAVSANIQILRDQLETLLTIPLSFAARVQSTAGSLLSLVPSLSQQGSTVLGSAAVQDTANDKPAVVLTEALDLGVEFDSDVAPTQGEILDDNASEEDLAEIAEATAARALAFATITGSVCLAITSTDFATINSVLTVAEALEPAFEQLFGLEPLDYLVYADARTLRAATLKHLSQVSAGLPRLRSFIVPRETDLFDILPLLYDEFSSEDEVETAGRSLLSLNSNAIADPARIPQGTRLLYLDELVA